MKRKRGLPYLDSIDLEILEFLNKTPKGHVGKGILEICKELKIAHVSAKPHLEKLFILGLLNIISDSEQKDKRRKKFGLVSSRIFNIHTWNKTKRIAKEVGTDIKDLELMKFHIDEENKYFENVLQLLRSTREYVSKKEKGSLSDLRVSKDIDKFLRKEK